MYRNNNRITIPGGFQAMNEFQHNKKFSNNSIFTTKIYTVKWIFTEVWVWTEMITSEHISAYEFIMKRWYCVARHEFCAISVLRIRKIKKKICIVDIYRVLLRAYSLVFGELQRISISKSVVFTQFHSDITCCYFRIAL